MLQSRVYARLSSGGKSGLNTSASRTKNARAGLLPTRAWFSSIWRNSGRSHGRRFQFVHDTHEIKDHLLYLIGVPAPVQLGLQIGHFALQIA